LVQVGLQSRPEDRSWRNAVSPRGIRERGSGIRERGKKARTGLGEDGWKSGGGWARGLWAEWASDGKLARPTEFFKLLVTSREAEGPAL